MSYTRQGPTEGGEVLAAPAAAPAPPDAPPRAPAPDAAAAAPSGEPPDYMATLCPKVQSCGKLGAAIRLAGGLFGGDTAN